MARHVLVTGANGFVGRAVLKHVLLQAGMTAVGSVRSHVATAGSVPSPISSPLIHVPGLERDTDWSRALSGSTTVIHCAARVHEMRETGDTADALARFRQVNVEGTLNLAQQAAQAGVSRFIFVSSVKVNGEATTVGRPFRASDPPAPKDPYAESKHEAEVRLRELARHQRMEYVIVRPPLVYGPGVKANFAALMRLLERRIPLPLGSVRNNRRSYVSLDNLVSLLVSCVVHPAAANQVFLVSDGEDLSTADLLRRMARAQGLPARLLPVPISLLKAGANLLGKREIATRLLGNLQVDMVPTCERLGWHPPITVDEGLRRAAQNT